MSRYEGPEGTGKFPGAGRQRLGSMARGRGRNGSDGGWDDEDGSPSGRRLPGRLGPSGRRAAPRSRAQRILGRRPLLSVLGILAALTLTLISLTAYAAYRNVYDSIHHLNVTDHMLGNRPPKLDGSTNILIIGSDSRAGTKGRYGRGIDGSRSDTSMMLHIPPNHNGALVVSFPRDTMVPVYQCDADGSGHKGQQAQPTGSVEQLNWTYSNGGPACLWKTLEQLTHIHIDHFIEVNFLSFRKIVDDVGGVPVCLPYAIKDPASKLNLPVGRSLVKGAQALAFVRERHIGEGSDLQRINRQQIFLASLAQKIKQSSSLTNPTKLYGLVHDIASSLTTDTGLTSTDMLAVANSLKGVSTGSLQFMTAPVLPYPANPDNQVEFWQPYAGQLFGAIARDNHLQTTAKRDARAKSQVPTVSTNKVHVHVLNATSTAGLAATTANQLTAKGYKVRGTGNASASSSTIIEYGSTSLLPEADTLLKEIPAAQLKLVSAVKGKTLNLVLGSGFKGLTSAHSATKNKSVSKVAKRIGKSTSGGGISGNTNICHDQSAFSGPDTPSMFSNG
ncbi:MAG TPA: LCP family protein [Streptosporangiaceae bacterium]|nr:LCP family protein [Streptosporangiaceae bacterium]